MVQPAPFIGITAAQNEDGRIEVFCIGSDNSIYHIWQVAPNYVWTPKFTKIGENDRARSIAMILNAQSELEIFYVGTDEHLYQNWQIRKNGDWHGENRISEDTYAKAIVAGINQDGTTQIFYRGTNDLLYYNVEDIYGHWLGEKQLPTYQIYNKPLKIESLAVLRKSDGSLFVVFTDQDFGGTLYGMSQAGPNTYDSWKLKVVGSLGYVPLGRIDRFQMALCPDSVIEAVWSNAYGLRYALDDWPGAVLQNTGKEPWLTTPIPFPPTVPPPIAGYAGSPNFAMCLNSDGLLELFYTDTNSVLNHCVQTAPHVWPTTATPTVGAAKQLILIPNQDKHLELIYIGTDNALYHNWQLDHTSEWNGEVPF